jgi:hypothetical protein
MRLWKTVASNDLFKELWRPRFALLAGNALKRVKVLAFRQLLYPSPNLCQELIVG